MSPAQVIAIAILWVDDGRRVMGWFCCVKSLFLCQKTILPEFCSILEVLYGLHILTEPGDRLPNPVIHVCIFSEGCLLTHRL
jgi:hypothetical protein